MKINIKVFIQAALLLSVAVLANASSARELQGNEITVGIVDDALPCSNETQTRYSGHAVDIWEEIASKSKIKYKYVTIPTFNQGVESAYSREIDIAISCFNIIPKRLEKVEFSTPYRDDGLSFLSRKQDKTLITFFKETYNSPFIQRSILALILFSLMISIFLWVLQGGFKNKDVVSNNSINTFFKGWMMITMGGGIYKLGENAREMTLLFISNIFRLVLVSIFVGTTTAVLQRDSKPTDASESKEELVEMLSLGVGVDKGTISQTWIERKEKTLFFISDPAKSKILTFTGDAQIILALEEQKVNSIIADTSRIEYLWKDKMSKNQSSLYTISTHVYNSTPQAFVYAESLPRHLRKKINIEIARMRFDETIKYFMGEQ